MQQPEEHAEPEDDELHSLRVPSAGTETAAMSAARKAGKTLVAEVGSSSSSSSSCNSSSSGAGGASSVDDAVGAVGAGSCNDSSSGSDGGRSSGRPLKRKSVLQAGASSFMGKKQCSGSGQ